MRKILLAVFVLLSVCASAQVNNSFRGTLNVFSATGLAPNYRVTGFFSDANGYYSSDSCQVGDVIFAFYTTTCVRFVVDSIITKAGSIITADVVDVDSITAAFPFGVCAIMRETPINGFPVNISGISGPLASCIETHFKGLVDVLQTGGTGGSPGNSQDTIVQVAHGLSLLDPVHVDTSGLWIVSNVSSDDSLHMAIVTEVIASDTFIVTYSGITSQPAHGYDVGRLYYVQDNGSYGLTAPPGLINDLAFYSVDANKLFITEQRPVAPMTDLNGIYSTSDTIPNGVGAYATDFRIHTDSLQVRWVGNEVVVTDNKTTPNGILYAGNGYVTDPLSLTTKGYVDSLIASVEIPDGDKGDIDVSMGGTVWEIDTSAVGSNEIADGAVTTTEILDGTITTTDLAFTPLTGASASTRLAVYTAANALTGYSTLTYNGGNTLLFNNGLAGSYFYFGGSNHYFRQEPTGTSGQILLASSNRILMFPSTNTNGLILYPSADNETTTAALRFSTGRSSIVNNNHITISTVQNITAGSSYVPSVNIANSITPDAINNISGSSIGGINIEQTYSTPSGTANQAMEYYGLRIAPSIDRNATSNDNSYGIYINPTLQNSAPLNWRGIYNNTASGYFIYDNAVANNYLSGNLSISYSPNTNYRLQVSRNSGTRPLALFSPAGSKFQIKGGTTESITNSPNNYNNYPSLAVLTSANSSTYEISAIGTTVQDRSSLFSGAQPTNTASNNTWSIIGHSSMQATPDAAFSISGIGVQGIGEYLLQTAENSDTDLSGATVTFSGIIGESKLSQDWSNGTLNFYAGRFFGNGVNSAGGTNATNNYGIYTYATGGTSSNWSIFSDDGDHYYEDNSKFGGSVATPTARVEIEGSGTTSATYGLQVENSSGANIVSVRDDRYVAFGATTGGSIVEMFTDASRKTYFDGFDILMYNRGSGQSQFGFFGGGGSLASPTDVAASENLGEFAWYGYYGGADRYANVLRSRVDSLAGTTVWGRFEFNYGTSNTMMTMFGKNNTVQVHGKLGVGTTPSTTSFTKLAASTTANSSLNITAGTQPTNSLDGDVWNNDSKNSIQVNTAGLVGTIPVKLFSGTADATVANTVTETTLIPSGDGTLSIPANYLTVGKTIKIEMQGLWTEDTTASTIQVRVELNGTLLCVTGIDSLVTCEGGQWFLTAYATVRSVGVSGTTYSQGEIEFKDTATTSTTHWMRRSATNTIDTTVANTIDVTATHGAADPDNSMTTTNCLITIY